MAQQESAKIAKEASAGSQRMVEQGVHVSDSLIWRLQRDFYTKRALKAWTEDQVPNYITNNPFIAEIYAAVIAAFVKDCQASGSAPLSPEKPLRILELGAGTGKFAYLLLRKLTALLRMNNIPMNSLRYTMTECSERVIAEWRLNSYLAEFAAGGLLDFEVLLACTGGQSKPDLNFSGGPLVVIANYVFDSLPHDAFSVDHGQLEEMVLTTKCDGSDDAFQDLRFSYQRTNVSSQRYADGLWNNILEQYRTRLPAATVLFPTAALQTVQQLGRCCDGRMLVLAADKGFAHEEDLALLPANPAFEFHAAQQCFSSLVNFDAIAKYFLSTGGEALLPPKHAAGLSLCAFLHHGPADDFPATRNAYKQAVDAFGPDDLFAIMSWLNAHVEEVSVLQALAVLRLTRWDPTALMRLFPTIARQLRSAGPERNDLRDAVLRSWDNHYPLSRDENVLAFYCAVILLELGFFSEAYAMFRKSQQLFGTSAATSYNLGLCCIGLNHPAEALELMREACSLDPTFEPARQSCLKLENQLKTGEREHP
jgi:tetratricopeptide (TPR) repeat protein